MKTVILSYGTNQISWRVSDSGPDLEAALVAKYLGVDITVQGRNLIKPRESIMIGSARAYAHTIMGCTHWGLDRSLTAYKLWECCAVPQFCMEQKRWSFPSLQLRNWRKSNTPWLPSSYSFPNPLPRLWDGWRRG